GRSCAAAERTYARGERQVEALARGALRARLAEEVRVGARAGAGLVRARLAATLGGMLASAAPGRPLATGRVACGRRAALTARRPRAGRRSPDDRPAFLLLALVGEPVGWRRHPSGPGAAFGALPRLVHTPAILPPQLP